MRFLYYRCTTEVNPYFKKSLHLPYYGANPSLYAATIRTGWT